IGDAALPNLLLHHVEATRPQLDRRIPSERSAAGEEQDG
ncbi:MAG: hypothetical protein HW394_1739, partial [Acidobacteria bacterium]|nr:hypothetical protein [Acidobacteriota bacterium]